MLDSCTTATAPAPAAPHPLALPRRQRCAVVTLGCKVNMYDGQVIRDRALAAGYEIVDPDAPGGVDVVVVNTCAVTMQGTAKSRRQIRRLRRAHPRARVVVTGCAAELPGERRGLLDDVDLVVSNQDKARLFQILDHGEAASRAAAADAVWGVSGFGEATRAYLKVEDGCDEFCTFCIIAHVRGRVVSRPIADAVDEARRLVDAGYREIVLTGIHLGAYGKDTREGDGDPEALARLVEALGRLDGLERLRLSSIEASEIPESLMEAFAASRNLCPHFHLPLQSGDDGVLRAMHRPYGRDRFLATVDALRARLDDPTFTTDVIVGFPGETEAAFDATLDVCRRARFLKIHIFPYSPRTRTAAARLQNRVPAGEIHRRKRILDRLERALSLGERRRFEGRVERVLVESKRDASGLLAGYTERYVRTLFPGGDGSMGDVVPVRLERISGRRTVGRIVDA